MKSINIAIIYSGLISLAACNPVLYSSVGQNVPLFHEKGEAALNGGYCSTWDAEGLSLQFATAATDKVVVISSLYSMSSPRYSTSGIWAGKGTYFEAGVGKYGYWPESKWGYELIAGIGTASIKNKRDFSVVNANYIKPFLQPSFGISGKIVEFAFTPRIGLVSYTSHSNTINDPIEQKQVNDYFNKRGTTLVFEPGVTFRIGYRNVKVQAQYNYSTFSYEGEDSLNPVNPEFISIGLHLLFTNRYKKD